MNIRVYLLIFFLIPYFSGVKCQARSYGDILKSLKYPEKLVFDVTGPLTELVGNSTSMVDPKSLGKTGTELSQILYFRPSGKYFKTEGKYQLHQKVYITGPDENDDGWGIMSKAASFLFSNPLTNTEESNFTIPVTTNDAEEFLESAVLPKDQHFTIVFHMQRWDIHSDKSGRATVHQDVVIQKLQDIILVTKSRYQGSVKVGLDYGIGWDDSDSGLILWILKQVDIVVLEVDLPLEKFILSYSMFKAYLKGQLTATYYSIAKGRNPNSQVYIKLNFLSEGDIEPTLEMTEKLYDKYYFYLLRFSVNWANDCEPEVLILPPFHKRLKDQDILNGVDLRKLVVRPVLLDDTIKVGWIPVTAGACENRAMMDQYDLVVSSIFQSHGLDQDFVEVSKYLPAFGQIRNIILGKGDCNPQNQPNCGNSTFLAEDCDKLKFGYTTFGGVRVKELSGYLLHTIDYRSTSQLPPEFTKNGAKTLPWTVLKVMVTKKYHGEPYDFSNTSKKQQLPNLIFVGDVPSECNFTGSQLSKVIWWMDLNQKFTNANARDLSDLSLKLIAIQVQLDRILQWETNSSLALQMVLGNSNHIPAWDMYCHPNEMLVRAMGREIVSFARIHSISIEVENMLAYTGWRMSKLMGEVDNLFRLTKIPMFVNRDYSNKLLTDDDDDDDYSNNCIEWTVDVPVRRIPLNAAYFGTTLYMSGFRNGSISSKELETMLIFIFHKFSIVEIIPATILHLAILLETFSDPGFIKELATQDSKSTEIYLRMDTRLFNKTEDQLVPFLEKLNNVYLKPAGVHFTNWSDSSNINFTQLENFLPEGVSLGISLENCLNDMLKGYFNGFTDSLSRLDYLVCNVKHRPEMESTNINRDKMQRYLDSTLYIQTYLVSRFPNLSHNIIFRLNALRSSHGAGMKVVELDGKVQRFERNQTSDFLTFQADVNQYAAFTKIKFFALPAFDDWNGERAGWWSIANFTTLEDNSVYVEKEADYLNQTTWRPEHKKEVRILSKWTEYIIIGTALFIILVLMTSLLGLRIWYQRKFRLLSPKEISAFRHGRPAEESGVSPYQFDCLKFPKEFELPKKSITLWKVIGQGNFGLVYDATLTHRDGSTTPVAVKIPKSDCSKQAFVSMLSELKVLSYVGHHPNVVEFVGCCIKEIGNGNVSIATRLCENGSLQDHLRKLHSELQEKPEADGSILSEMTRYELNRFSQEIAAGMEYVGKMKIVHGDLATRNVLLDSNLTCKIADFGLSRKLYEYAQYVKKKSEPLPWRWMAVESLKRMEFTVKSDVYSYGVTLWEIFSLGSVPYPGLSWTVGFADELENGMRMEYPAYSTDEIYDAMLSCWRLNPDQRPGFDELYQFFAKNRDSGYENM